jgi:uncharacterized protein YyaL (SSP411 family)
MKTNRLATESSPYLRQHARNPVDWYPWGPEALALAAREDKPIFLSIGYSACHWCHVMAHESFEDPATAAKLDEGFVSIKVDREERPDLDALYMRAVLLMTGSGGWPLSVFLTPDLKPFFGGTYFPKEERWGVPSFRQVLDGVSRAYAGRRGDVTESADRLLKAVAESFRPPAGKGLPDRAAADAAREAVLARYDDRHGGFGAGPKFPQPALLHFLLDESVRAGDRSLAERVFFTLGRMEAGGVRDQLGGGFHRYSVDGEWLVPHFEKMLYDNAQLAALYFRAAALGGGDRFRSVAREVLADMRRSMAAPGGGFVAALDADSEGEEGLFYLWTPDQIAEVLGAEEGALVARLYGVTGGPSLEGRILHRAAGLRGGPPESREVEPALAGRLRADLDGLLSARERRVHPGVDTKVLTDWNALAAIAFLEGGLDGSSPEDLESGLGTLEALWSRCWDGRLLRHLWDGERPRIPGFLSDYAYACLALWKAFEATGDPGHLDRFRLLLEGALRRFRDPAGGTFVDAPAAQDPSGPPVAVRDADDGVLPAPLSVVAGALWRWERLTGSEEAAAALTSLLAEEGGALAANPGAQPLLAGLAAARCLPQVDVVVAAPSMREALPYLRVARRLGGPDCLVLPLLSERLEADVADRYALFRGRSRPAGAAAFVCAGGSCRSPAVDPDALEALLREDFPTGR